MTHRIRAIVVVVIGAALALSSLGCVGPVTSVMWEYALKTKVDGAFVYGCIVDRDMSPPHVRALVASYQGGVDMPSGWANFGYKHTESYQVLIPLDQDGTPVPPFGYRGNEREVERVWDDVPSEQRAAVLGWKFEDAEFEAGRVAMGSKKCVPLANFYVEIGPKWPREEAISGWFRDSDGTLKRIEPGYFAPPTPVPPSEVPDNAHILLLPYAVPRPVRARNWAIAIAVVSTPSTILQDTIAPPIFIVQYAIAVGHFP
jgi:hypothetical protein